MRLIGVDGSQLGIFNTPDALRIADEQNLDLVEVAPNGDPPVARIMDYGKYKYEEAIKAKKARKHQTTVQVKEIKFRPKIDKHDYETKKRHVVRFLEAGAKVKVTIMFRGREMVHPERGLAILSGSPRTSASSRIVESAPKLEGRNMFMLRRAGEEAGAAEGREAPRTRPGATPRRGRGRRGPAPEASPRRPRRVEELQACPR